MTAPYPDTRRGKHRMARRRDGNRSRNGSASPRCPTTTLPAKSRVCAPVSWARARARGHRPGLRKIVSGATAVRSALTEERL
jgi:hypothetical protein